MGATLWAGIAAGGIMAVMCVLFYAKGVKDGMDVKKGRRPQFWGGMQNAGEAESEINKKFEAILAYDPYTANVEESEDGEGGCA